MSIFIGFGFVGLPEKFPQVLLELLDVSIVTEIACLSFLVFPIFWSWSSGLLHHVAYLVE